MPKILVVDDELKIARLVRDYLVEAGFDVVVATDGPGAVAQARTAKPDLIVLDIGLPGIDGLDATRAILKYSETPIVMLTARSDETDRIIGLELGADDYVVKPFSPRELVARVKAVLRRTTGTVASEMLRVGDLEIELSERRVLSGGSSIELTTTEFELLVVMAGQPGRVFTPRPATRRAVRGRVVRFLRAGDRFAYQEPAQKTGARPGPSAVQSAPSTASATSTNMRGRRSGWAGPPWSGHRGPGSHIRWRIFGFLFFLLIMSAIVGGLVACVFAPGRGWFLLVGLAVIVGFASIMRRVFRRTWAPISELIEATTQLGEGDTSVRMAGSSGPWYPVTSSFNKMAERLEDEDEQRRRLLADLGHELRTPLTVIRGEIEAVIDGIHPAASLTNVVDEVRTHGPAARRPQHAGASGIRWPETRSRTD